jgi:hypothetical protein
VWCDQFERLESLLGDNWQHHQPDKM